MLRPINYKAFLVDDDKQILNMLKMNFELNGFICQTSSDPQKAVESAVQFTPDIIISDLHMPGIDGFTLRKEILSNDALKNIPFVFLTSKDDEKLMLEGFDMSINDYVVKTTSSSVLVKKIHSILISNEKFKKGIKENYKKKASDLDPSKERERIVLKDYEIDYLTIPFDDTPGGDFIEKIQLDENRSVFVLADVMGKRWDAWFHSFPFKSYIRSTVKENGLNSDFGDVANVLTNLNALLSTDTLTSNHSIAITVIQLDTLNNRVQIAGAGCLPLLKIRETGEIEELSPIECALGLSKNAKYESQTICLERGDRIISFTDGLIEVPNRYKEQLGFAGLLNALKCYRNEYGIEWIESLVRNYTNNKLTDDLTLIQIKRNN